MLCMYVYRSVTQHIMCVCMPKLHTNASSQCLNLTHIMIITVYHVCGGTRVTKGKKAWKSIKNMSQHKKKNMKTNERKQIKIHTNSMKFLKLWLGSRAWRSFWSSCASCSTCTLSSRKPQSYFQGYGSVKHHETSIINNNDRYIVIYSNIIDYYSNLIIYLMSPNISKHLCMPQSKVPLLGPETSSSALKQPPKFVLHHRGTDWGKQQR